MSGYFSTDGSYETSEGSQPQVRVPVLLPAPCECMACEHTRSPSAPPVYRSRRLRVRPCFIWVKKYLIGLLVLFALTVFVLTIRWSLEMQDKYEWAEAIVRPTGDCFQPLRIRVKRDIPTRCKDAAEFVERSFFMRYVDVAAEDWSAFKSWLLSFIGIASITLWVLAFVFVVNLLDRWSAALNLGVYLNYLMRVRPEKGSDAQV